MKGLIQIYTGEGKGKTTQAVGQALRARGHGLRVCLIHFFKKTSGEDAILKKIGIHVLHCVNTHPAFHRRACRDTLKATCLKALSDIGGLYKKYDMVILDEINIAIRDGFLQEDELIAWLKAKPHKLHVVLTGRGASQKLIRAADVVSVIKKTKHPFDKGIAACKGIEF